MAHNSNDNYYDLFGMDPNAAWNPNTFEAALAEKIVQWRGESHAQDQATREAAKRYLSQVEQIRATMNDAAAREAQRQAALQARRAAPPPPPAPTPSVAPPMLGPKVPGGPPPQSPKSPAAPLPQPPKPPAVPSPMPRPPVTPPPINPQPPVRQSAPQTSGDDGDWLCGRNHVNPPGKNICQTAGCGEARYVTCPQCGRTHIEAAQSQCSCGFDLHGRIRAEDALRRADAELAAGQFSLTQRDLSHAENEWTGQQKIAADDPVARHARLTKQHLTERMAARGDAIPRSSNLSGAGDSGGPSPTPGGAAPANANSQQMSVAGPVPTPGTPQPRPLPPAAPIHDDSLNVNDPSLPPPPAVPPRQPPQHPPAPPQGAAPPLQPATPGKIEVQVMDGNDAVPPTVRLKWSPAHSGAAYSVIYKSEKDPQSSHQVYFYGHDTTDRSDTTPATENTHRVELEHGFPYGYGITYGVYVKGETHMHAVSDRVIVHAEVEAIRVTPGDRTATIEWDPPSEAAIIGYKVYIKPKGEPDAAAKGFDVPDRTQKSVPFSGLKNDVPYEVRVCCVYQDLNEKAKQQAQTGQPAQVLPHTAGRRHAFMVNATLQWQIAAKILESSAHQSQPSVNPRVAIRWNRDQIVRGARLEFHQSASGFPALQPCAFHEMLGTRIGSELDPNDPAYATSQTFTYDVASNTSHVVGYQKYNGLAYPSNVVPVSTVGDITDVDAIDTGNMIFFTWMWPESANPTQEVTIYGFPDGQNNARPFTKTIDRQTYDQVSTFGISKEKILGGTNTMNTGVWFLVNTTPLNSDGNPQHPSAGQYIFVSHRFRIEYWFTKEVGWLQMKLKYVPGPSDRPLVVLPALELHYEVGRWPLKPSDRSLLQQFPPGVVDNREVTLDLRHQLPTNSYGRLFVSNLDTNLKYDQLLDKLFKDYEGRVDLWHFVRHNRISTFFTQRYELLPRPHDKGVITLADMRLG